MFKIEKMRKAPVPSEADRGGVGSGSLRCPTGNGMQRLVEHGFSAIISGGEDGAGFFPVPPSAVLMLRKKGACQGILIGWRFLQGKNTTRSLTRAQGGTVKMGAF